jgi:hypothetical protein
MPMVWSGGQVLAATTSTRVSHVSAALHSLPEVTDLYQKALRRVRRFMKGQSASVLTLGDEEDFDQSDHLTFAPARDGWFGVVRDGVTLESSYAPLAHAQRVIEREDLEGAEMMVIIDCGSCAVAIALLDATLCDGTRIAVLEPDPELLYGALARADALDDCDPDRLGFFTSVQSLKLHVGNHYRDSRRLLVLATPAYRRLYPELLGEVGKELEEAVFLANIALNTGEARSRQWVNNLLDNLARSTEHPSFFALDKKFESVPAVIVSAGPSLDKNVHLLNEMRDRVLIMCVNTSLKAVVAAGVRPHIVMSLESLNVSSHFEGVDLSDITVILDQTCHPSLFDLPAQRFFTFLDSSRDYVSFKSRAMKDDGVQGLCVGGSIANATFSAAFTMGCDPIMLIGQDLAYTDGQMYARGTVFEDLSMDFDGDVGVINDPTGIKQAILDASAEDEQDPVEYHHARSLLEVPSWDGQGIVKTSMDFNMFRFWFQEAAIHMQTIRDLTLVNATEGGAWIEGYEHISLAQAKAKYIDAETERDLDDMIGSIWSEAPRYDTSVYRDGMQRAVKDCEKLIGRCDSARKAVKRARTLLHAQGHDSIPFRKAVAKLEKAEKRVAKASRDSSLVGACLRSVMTQIIEDYYSKQDGTTDQRWVGSLDHSERVMGTIGEAARELLARLRAAAS